MLEFINHKYGSILIGVYAFIHRKITESHCGLRCHSQISQSLTVVQTFGDLSSESEFMAKKSSPIYQNILAMC